MIRPLAFEELEAKIPFVGPLFFKEAGLPGCFNPLTYTRLWQRLYRENNGVIYESSADGKAHGWIGGSVMIDPLTDEKIGMEMFWYALPEHRGLGAIKLLKRMEEWVKAQGAKRFLMVHLEKLNSAKMACFYKRSGYELLEHFYLKQLWP